MKRPEGFWDGYFMGMADYVASASKDPKTQVGALALSNARAVLETGYNGLPRGVEDRPDRMERPAKYIWTAHAEENLVAHAARKVLEGTTVYVTHFCCNVCTRMLINAGVSKVVVGPGKTSMPQELFDAAKTMFCEAGVTVEMYSPVTEAKCEHKVTYRTMLNEVECEDCGAILPLPSQYQDRIF